MTNHAPPTLPSAAASNHGAASPSLALPEARQLRDELKLLLRKEQAAMAEFLVALADFDRRRGWEPLGHAGLFAFLVAELGLSKSAAYYRRSAAELLQVFPEVIEPLREGKLCLSTIGELAKVLTEENRAVVTPRFFGLAAREAQELVAELQPRHVPSTRMIVTRVFDQPAAPARFTQPVLSLMTASAAQPSSESAPAPATTSASAPPPTPVVDPNVAPLSRFPTSGIAHGGGANEGGADGRVGRLLPRLDEITPLTANLHRVHFNVDRQVVMKLKTAREGLSHAIRGATMEQVLEAALDLLLEKQSRARGQVKRPRATIASAPAGVAAAREVARPVVAPPPAAPPAAAAPAVEAAPPLEAAPRLETQTVTTSHRNASPIQRPLEPAPPLALLPTAPPPPRRTEPREAIPAAVCRAVWARDQGRCSWPIDGGGRCGSTHRLELDHVIPWAEWGPSTVENLRVVCGLHNALAARKVFGQGWMDRYRRGGAGRVG